MPETLISLHWNVPDITKWVTLDRESEIQSAYLYIAQQEFETIKCSRGGEHEMTNATKQEYCTDYALYADAIIEYERESIDSAHNGTQITILHQIVSIDGTCATVYEIHNVRYYRAMEYLEEQGEVSAQYGYETTEKYCYMGQRYKGLFGEYEEEVFRS
jgi:hypothetical protein